MEVVLHAGCYKTATSSIQLIANIKRDLLAADGILFPITGLRRNEGSDHELSRGHHSLYHKISNDGDPREVVAKLEEEIAASPGAKRIFLSTELLAGSPVEIKHRFLESYAPWGNFRIEYAIRAPDEYAESINNQMRKAGRTHRQFGRLPYRDDVAHWVELLGRDAVHLSYFAKGNARGFIDGFFARLGVGSPVFVEGLNDNPAVSLKGMLFREATLSMFRKQGSHDRRARQRVMNALRDFDANVLSASPKAITLSPEDRREILRKFRGDMEALAEYLSPEERQQALAELDEKKLDSVPRKNVDDPISISRGELVGFAELVGQLGLVGASAEGAGAADGDDADDASD